MIRMPQDRQIHSSLLMMIVLIPVHLLPKMITREQMIRLNRIPALVVNPVQTEVVMVRQILSRPTVMIHRDQPTILQEEAMIHSDQLVPLLIVLAQVMIHSNQQIAPQLLLLVIHSNVTGASLVDRVLRVIPPLVLMNSRMTHRDQTKSLSYFFSISHAFYKDSVNIKS